jgi:hypothetical protein
MVGVFLVIQMPDPSDERSMTLRFRPINCFFLGFERTKLMVRMVFDYIILYGRSLRATLRAGFDINVRHSLLSIDTLDITLSFTRNKTPRLPAIRIRVADRIKSSGGKT